MGDVLLRRYMPGRALATPVTPVVSRKFQTAVSFEVLKGSYGAVAVRTLAHQVQRTGASSARQRQQQQQQLQQKLVKASAIAPCLPALRGVPDTARKALEAHTARSSAVPPNQRSRQSSRFLSPPVMSQGLSGAGRPSRDGEARLLAAAAVEAARLNASSVAYWNGVVRRAQDFADALTAAEIAALLNALSRSGQATGDDFASLLQKLAPRVAALMPSFTSGGPRQNLFTRTPPNVRCAVQLQLAQVLSAFSKVQTAETSALQPAKARISRLLTAGEFQQPFELAMVLSASLADTGLLEEIARHTQRLMGRTHFPVRDLAVIAHAFASASFIPLEGFKAAADAALKGLEAATLLDIARLVQAFASAAAQCASWPSKECEGEKSALNVSQNLGAAFQPSGTLPSGCGDALVPGDAKAAFLAAHRRLFHACVEVVGERILFATPAELSVAAQAFGLVLVESHGEDGNAIATILQSIRRVAVTSLGLFLPQQLTSLLHTFARWRLPFPPADLVKVMERLSQLSGMRGTGSSSDEAQAAGGGVAWHPVFSSGSSNASLDTASRLRCLHSLGVLLRPYAAATAACSASCEQSAGYGCTGGFRRWQAPDAMHCLEADSSVPSRSSGDTSQLQQGARDAASEAVAAGERLFEQWLNAIFSQMTSGNGERRPAGAMADTPAVHLGIQPVVRLAEVLANCALFSSTHRFVGPLQQLVLQRHHMLDADNASKLLHYFRILGLPEDHDMLLLLQERAEQTLKDLPAAGNADITRRARARMPPITIHGHSFAVSASA